MNNKAIYYEFTNNFFKKLCEAVNGKIIYEQYPEIDTVIFKIEFKGFNFRFPVDKVSEHIYNGDSDKLIEELKTKYSRAIMNAFFKNNRRGDYKDGKQE